MAEIGNIARGVGGRLGGTETMFDRLVHCPHYQSPISFHEPTVQYSSGTKVWSLMGGRT